MTSEIERQLRAQGVDVDTARLHTVVVEALRKYPNRPSAMRSLCITLQSEQSLLRALLDPYVRRVEQELRGGVSHQKCDSPMNADHPVPDPSSGGACQTAGDGQARSDRAAAPSTPAGDSQCRRDRQVQTDRSPRAPVRSTRAATAVARATSTADKLFNIEGVRFRLGAPTRADIANIMAKGKILSGVGDAYVAEKPLDEWPEDVAADAFLSDEQFARIDARVDAIRLAANALAKELSHAP